VPVSFVATIAGGLLIAALLFLLDARRLTPPPGDSTRRSRRAIEGGLLLALACGLVAWDQIEAAERPLLFLHVSLVLLALAGLLVVVAIKDFLAVRRAHLHRRLSTLTKEVYGFPLADVDGKEAEQIGRKALKKLLDHPPERTSDS